mmetsp:Transcript_38628/g.120973  ORF Transcript_38628/g.120973 Transcript_38628/m.120973 type:complete len:749 (+) Transcript_38628:713-2959(+)
MVAERHVRMLVVLLQPRARQRQREVPEQRLLEVHGGPEAAAVVHRVRVDAAVEVLGDLHRRELDAHVRHRADHHRERHEPHVERRETLDVEPSAAVLTVEVPVEHHRVHEVRREHEPRWDAEPRVRQDRHGGAALPVEAQEAEDSDAQRPGGAREGEVERRGVLVELVGSVLVRAVVGLHRAVHRRQQEERGEQAESQGVPWDDLVLVAPALRARVRVRGVALPRPLVPEAREEHAHEVRRDARQRVDVVALVDAGPVEGAHAPVLGVGRDEGVDRGGDDEPHRDDVADDGAHVHVEEHDQRRHEEVLEVHGQEPRHVVARVLGVLVVVAQLPVVDVQEVQVHVLMAVAKARVLVAPPEPAAEHLEEVGVREQHDDVEQRRPRVALQKELDRLARAPPERRVRVRRAGAQPAPLLLLPHLRAEAQLRRQEARDEEQGVDAQGPLREDLALPPRVPRRAVLAVHGEDVGVVVVALRPGHAPHQLRPEEEAQAERAHAVERAFGELLVALVDVRVLLRPVVVLHRPALAEVPEVCDDVEAPHDVRERLPLCVHNEVRLSPRRRARVDVPRRRSPHAGPEEHAEGQDAVEQHHDRGALVELVLARAAVRLEDAVEADLGRLPVSAYDVLEHVVLLARLRHAEPHPHRRHRAGRPVHPVLARAHLALVVAADVGARVVVPHIGGAVEVHGEVARLLGLAAAVRVVHRREPHLHRRVEAAARDLRHLLRERAPGVQRGLARSIRGRQRPLRPP